MTVYRKVRSPFWQYDFWFGGRRYFGSTKTLACSLRGRGMSTAATVKPLGIEIGTNRNVAALRGARAAIRRRARLQRRYVGLSVVPFAVGPLRNRIAAEAKSRVTRIAARPAAGVRGERVDFLGGGQAWVGGGGCLGARRCRLDQEGGGRPRFGAAIRPAGDKDGGLLDLANRHRARAQEADQDGDSAWDATAPVLPAADAARADAEQLSGAVLGDAERAKGRAEFGRVRFFRLESAQGAPQRKAGWQRSRTAILALK
jgi:hypothetical protein